MTGPRPSRPLWIYGQPVEPLPPRTGLLGALDKIRPRRHPDEPDDYDPRVIEAWQAEPEPEAPVSPLAAAIGELARQVMARRQLKPTPGFLGQLDPMDTVNHSGVREEYAPIPARSRRWLDSAKAADPGGNIRLRR